MAKKIGILSDTHGFIPDQLFDFFKDCDELWHAGDWGDVSVAGQLTAFKPVRGVYGNIDGREIRMLYPEVLRFDCEGMQICMLHIGGYPGKYSPQFKQVLKDFTPDLMICGHSHILKVMRDQEKGIMHINPGAAGNKGFHTYSTAIRLDVSDGRLLNLEVWEAKRISLLKE
jgi:putative phosphoesterase